MWLLIALYNNSNLLPGITQQLRNPQLPMNSSSSSFICFPHCGDVFIHLLLEIKFPEIHVWLIKTQEASAPEFCLISSFSAVSMIWFEADGPANVSEWRQNVRLQAS